MNQSRQHLSDDALLELRRWNTPTVYNGWEQITRHNAARDGFNREPVQDYMPHMGPMVGYAVTVIIEPSNARHPKDNPEAWSQYRQYIASVPGPKIVVVQDLDKPHIVGAFCGEVNSSIHRALGCVGSICDGGLRDLDEINAVGFKVLARGFGVGHAHSCPVRWDVDVEVFGRKIAPGQLIHADKHGFLAVPSEDEVRLLEAARFMDSMECKTLIAAARDTVGKPSTEICAAIDRAGVEFSRAAREKFDCKGEW